MDERAEIWIARDPETESESRPVSLRKLRKGLQISRLKPNTLVKRVGATEWVTLERLLNDAALLAARSATPPPPQVRPASTPPPPLTAARPAPPRPASTPPRPRSTPPPKITPPPAAALPLVVVEAAPPELASELEEIEPIEVADAAAKDAKLAAELERAAAAAVPIAKEPAPEPVPEPIARVSAPPKSDPDESASLTVQWFMEPPPEPGDDEPIFAPQTSVLDLRFERVGSVRLVRLAYVLVLATLAGAVVASIVHALSAMSNGQNGATALALVPVVVLACAFVGAAARMMLEVLLMLARIADRLAALARAQGIR